MSEKKKEFVGCKNWKPDKCTHCGAYLGLSLCFDPIKFETVEEADAFYQSKGGEGADRMMVDGK